MKGMNRRIASGSIVVACLLVSAGCGGSGGGGGEVCGQPQGTLVYRTDWSENAVTGARSQVVELRDPGGTTLRRLVLNRPFGETVATLGPVPSGLYDLEVRLFDDLDGRGSQFGSILAREEVCGEASVASAIAGTPNRVVITPRRLALEEGQTADLAAHLAAGSTALFSRPEDFTWSATGAVRVSENGRLTALAAGSGTVFADHRPTGLRASLRVTVRQGDRTRAKWTVLVFMNAANDLHPFSDLNMNQMERVASNPAVRFVVQWKQSRSAFPNSSFDGTRRYLVRPDTTDQIASQLVQNLGSGVDMGAPETLRDFLRWGKANYPADRYVLVVWNHGNGWRRAPFELGRAVSYDDETGNAIQIWELGRALGEEQFDILAWDASLMQMIEVAYEVRRNARYVVGSQESPPGEGYPYDRIFARFRDNPDAETVDLARAFVEGMLAPPEYQRRRITQSVIDTRRLEAAAQAFDALAAALLAHRDEISDAVRTARTTAQSYSPTATRFFRDAVDLIDKLRAEGVPPAVDTAAARARSAVLEAVVWEGHNANSPGSRGLSIDFSPGDVFRGAALDYRLMEFGRDTRWGDWLTVAP